MMYRVVFVSGNRDCRGWEVVLCQVNQKLYIQVNMREGVLTVVQ